MVYIFLSSEVFIFFLGVIFSSSERYYAKNEAGLTKSQRGQRRSKREADQSLPSSSEVKTVPGDWLFVLFCSIERKTVKPRREEATCFYYRQNLSRKLLFRLAHFVCRCML